MSRTTLGVLVAILGAASVALWLWSRERGAQPATSAAAPTAATTTADQPAASPTPDAPGKPRVRRMEDPTSRTALLEQIRAAKQRRASSSSSGSTTSTPAPELPPAAIDKSYIQSSVRALIPLVVECYEDGLTRDPKLAGKVVVDFTIEGEPGVGGVIGESTIVAADSTLVDPQVRECIQETMFALEIEPPEGGGVTRVTYPFVFRPAADPP